MRTTAAVRWKQLVWLWLGLLLTSGCVTSRRAVPRVLPLYPPVAAEELVRRIADLQHVQAIRAAVQLQFVDYRDAMRGVGKAYPSASGALVLRRPQSIRLRVHAALLGALADMTSDGQQFTVAVFYPTDQQVFIRGSNTKTYTVKASNSGLARDVSAFASLRPQHLSIPLLPPPIPSASSDASWSVFETRRDEMLTSQGRAEWIIRTYYLLYVAQRDLNGQWRPRFVYWFDRTQPGTPLTRLEVFEENGTLGTISDFGGYATAGGVPKLLPEWVQILRPAEGYALRVVFQSPEINPPGLPEDVFVVTNDRNLKVVDLDARP